MKQLTLALLAAATAGAVGWLVSHQRQTTPPALMSNADAPRDPMVRRPPSVDPKMVKPAPNVDPKMVKRPAWPKVATPEPAPPSES